MTHLEKMHQWLQTFPLWGDQPLTVDHTDPVPGRCGLYAVGQEEISRHQDVVGNVRVRNRCTYILKRVTTGQQNSMENAQWLMALQQWLQEQSYAGLAPVFGDEPAAEQIRGEKGRLQDTRQTGTGVYTVTVTVEFTKIYGNKGE